MTGPSNLLLEDIQTSFRRFCFYYEKIMFWSTMKDLLLIIYRGPEKGLLEDLPLVFCEKNFWTSEEKNSGLLNEDSLVFFEKNIWSFLKGPPNFLQEDLQLFCEKKFCTSIERIPYHLWIDPTSSSRTHSIFFKKPPVLCEEASL